MLFRVLNCTSKVRQKKSNFWGVFIKKRPFLVLRLHKKALIPRLFPVDLDAPYRDLERTFILRAIKNIEI